MKTHHWLGLAVGYLGLGAAWLAAFEHVLPVPLSMDYTPPGGWFGQVALWPWAAGAYGYSLAKYGKGVAMADSSAEKMVTH